MADEELDESQDESDENLDDELDETSDESGDDSAESETSEDEQDQSTDDESDDSSSQEEESEDEATGDESGDSEKPKPRTPEQIAKYERQRRKKAEREFADYKRKHGGNASETPDGPKLPPGGLADRFFQTVVKVDINEIATTDPTVAKRAGTIKKIIFEEMPWLQKDPNGVRIANDIAKGRLIKTVPETEPDETVQRKTTPPSPRRPQSNSKPKPLTADQQAGMTEAQLREYEADPDAYLAKQKK